MTRPLRDRVPGGQFIHLGLIDEGLRAELRRDGRQVVLLDELSGGWSLSDVVIIAGGVAAQDVETLVEVLARGGSVALDGTVDAVDAVLDDAARLGVDVVEPGVAAIEPAVGGRGPDAAWRADIDALMKALSAGAGVDAAARAAHLSVRSAYRRLAEARSYYGAATTTAAVVAWQRDRNVPPS